MEVYRNEGCWYCHTQYRRETALDAAGERLPTEAYLGLAPAMLGHERIGPDLTSGLSDDEQALVEYLRDPGADGEQSAMPSYAYLGEEDLRALAAYLLSFR